MTTLTIKISGEVEERLQQEAAKNEATMTELAGALLAEALSRRQPFFERLIAAGEGIPSEDWAGMPIDSAENLDHYLYGSPKRPL